MAGRPLGHLTEEATGSPIDLLELHTDLNPDPGRSWSAYVTDSVRNDFASINATVAGTGAGGERLVDECVQLLSRYKFPVLQSDDLVHGDFRLGNILFDGDQVSGVIDVEALGSGSSVSDYATVLDHQAADDAAVELLVNAGSRVAGPAALAHCLVQVVLDLALFMHRRLPTADPPSQTDGPKLSARGFSSCPACSVGLIDSHQERKTCEGPCC